MDSLHLKKLKGLSLQRLVRIFIQDKIAQAGLPFGITYFQPKLPILVQFAGRGMDDFGAFHGHLVYLWPIWYTFTILVYFCQFGKLLPIWYIFAILVYFCHFGLLYLPRKIWQPLL
jgi:hypothetical protein